VGNLNPYVTLGRSPKHRGGTDFDQIYASFGLGIKTKLTDCTLRRKKTQYMRGKNLLSEEDKTVLALQTLILE
jgi:hypothetical protein